MAEKEFKYDWQSHVVLIGKPPGILKSLVVQDGPLSFKKKSQQLQNFEYCPIEIQCSNNILSVIDQKGSLWVMGGIFCEPVNLSELVHIKAKKVFVGQGQLLFESKRKGVVLITWASKPEFKNQKLRKIPLGNGKWNHLIDAYFVEQQNQQGSNWYYSTVKKLQYTTKLYRLSKTDKTMIGYPFARTMIIPSKPAGMSLGKYHGLLWTEQGKLFGWGSKNLGLGLRMYRKSFYDELQEIEIPEPIIKAYASTSYSLALGSSGSIYEWGIKQNQQPLLTPQKIDMKGMKFVDLKGYEDYFGGLTSNNQLYLWGKGLEQIFGQETILFEDYQIIQKQQGVKILDFLLQENFFVVVLSEDKGVLNKLQKNYFNSILSNVTSKWLPHRSKGRAFKSAKKSRKVFTPTCTPPLFRQDQDFIDRLIGQKISKQKYFESMQDQQTLFKQLMKDSSPPKLLRQITGEPLKSARDQVKKPKHFHRKVQSTRQTSTLLLDNENAERLIKEFDDQRQWRNKMRKIKFPVHNNSHKLLSYEERRQAAAIRRNESQKIKITETKAKKKTVICMKIPSEVSESDQSIKVLASSFIKCFLIKFLAEPLLFAKHVKLKHRKSQQTFNKIANNMKYILGRQRAVHFLRLLQEQQPQRFQLMKRILGGAMRKWKQAKVIQSRKKIVKTTIVSTLSTKIHLGLGNLWLKTRKLAKVAQWLYNDQQQRLSQIKNVWKKTLLLYIKPTPSFENKNPIISREEVNFKSTLQRFKSLKLEVFLKQSPLCHWTLPFPVSLRTLEKSRDEAKEFSRSWKNIPEFELRKGVSWAQNNCHDLRGSSRHNNEKKTLCVINHSGITDILLYSVHYDSFFKPKNCQINIPDNMKLSEAWVSQERETFDNLLKDIIFMQWKQFWLSRRQFQLKLALFIRDNYDSLSQFRWKYILEFNQVRHVITAQSLQKQRELRRILSLIGAESLLNFDVIPQKYKTLDVISKVKGAPSAPIYETYLNNALFKKFFKIYYQIVLMKAKQMRKSIAE